VIGGLVGGALGNQVGKGDGRTAATVIGVVGGAAVGNEIEKDRRTRLDGYRLDIRLDDGRTLSVTRPAHETWTAGQRVRVSDGAVSLV
jgi:outer membrane lipoprotein SlyB